MSDWAYIDVIIRVDSTEYFGLFKEERREVRQSVMDMEVKNEILGSVPKLPLDVSGEPLDVFVNRTGLANMLIEVPLSMFGAQLDWEPHGKVYEDTGTVDVSLCTHYVVTVHAALRYCTCAKAQHWLASLLDALEAKFGQGWVEIVS